MLRFDVDRLLRSVAAAAQGARACGRPGLISRSVPIEPGADPVGIFAGAARLGGARAFFARPSEDFWLVGAGEARAIEVSGQDRFQRAAAAHSDAVGSVFRAGIDDEPGPIFVGGFGFNADPLEGPWGGIPNGLLAVPRWTFFKRGAEARACLNLTVDETAFASDPPLQLRTEAEQLLLGPACSPEASVVALREEFSFARWREAVRQVLGEIDRQNVSKVTLARTLRLRAGARIAPEPALRRLLGAYSGCTVFALERPGFCFLGATPEDLVSLDERRARSTCMAGSVWGTAANGARAGSDSGSMWSDKELREHAAVADWVRERMAGLCRDLEWNPTPRTVRVGRLHHLETHFSGAAQSGSRLLDFVAALHPTPAVAGVPLKAALDLIRKLEAANRGWYAGPVGWIDASGGGHFGLAIRSALLRGDQALLYAGAGLVKGSDPRLEYEETGMKFSPLLYALGAE